MTKEEIDKWLDEEYGCSYTRLEELHDFYFEKYADLREENKQLKEEKEELKSWLEEQKQFIDDIPTFAKDIKNNHLGMIGAYQNTLVKIKELEEGVK